MWCPVVLLAILTVLTEQVLTHGPLLAVDRWTRDTVQGWVAADPWPWTNTLAERWTDFGVATCSGAVLTAVTLVVTVRLRSWRPLVAAVLAALALFGTVIPGKILIGRPGPEGAPVASGDWGWFPSGHTATASICLGTAALVLGTAWPRLRRLVYTGTAFLCTGVGFCLIWRNYHWLWDVVASGCLTGIVLWLLLRWPLSRGHRPRRDQPQR
ncbi:phosphatase PAP2 family protein [Streptacidiphilus neutrinimicus]|uniref:phosphatase PAP2 family protein n=1 Tax=Streptacidiphilus neutrinimicus TaxID=105420 RepID=UPI0005A8C980|nr:phosphatase PAP2 family protein [Streptacidiphilus neutrinimicus]